MAKKFAAFDIDGTIIRWQLYHAIVDTMASSGIMSRAEFDHIIKHRMNWKTRQNSDSFRTYEHELIKISDNAIIGLDSKKFDEIARSVFNQYKEQSYTFTRDLIKDLKKKDYLLFAISGSPEQIVEMIAKFYGFDDYVGTPYELKNGKFTGKKDVSVGHKADLLNRLITKHEATKKGSVCVGDSEGDIDMLSEVETPIAFNPTKKLYLHAKKMGWDIVIERKNVVYKLSKLNNKYSLT